jgi:integrase
MLILTGVRTVRLARYDEFDRTTMIWSVPGFDKDGTQRTKNGEDHRVPITTSMLAIIDAMEKVRIDPSPECFRVSGYQEQTA